MRNLVKFILLNPREKDNEPVEVRHLITYIPREDEIITHHDDRYMVDEVVHHLQSDTITITAYFANH